MNNTLYIIEKELLKFKDIDPKELLKSCIDHKLLVTLENYNFMLDLNSEYLLTRNSCKVLKAITKIQKKQDKEHLEDMQIEDKENE